jgi:hypothetical protein
VTNAWGCPFQEFSFYTLGKVSEPDQQTLNFQIIQTPGASLSDRLDLFFLSHIDYRAEEPLQISLPAGEVHQSITLPMATMGWF